MMEDDCMKKIIHSIKPFLLSLFYKNLKVKFLQRRWESGLQIRLSSNGKLCIGKKCNFRKNLQLRVCDEGTLVIGENVFCNTNVSITSRNKIIIGNNVKIANNVVIVDHDHDYKNNLVGYKNGTVQIGNNVWIGANCVIMRDTIIEDNCVIGAGTVLKGTYEENSVIIARPEQAIKRFK